MSIFFPITSSNQSFYSQWEYVNTLKRNCQIETAILFHFVGNKYQIEVHELIGEQIFSGKNWVAVSLKKNTEPGDDDAGKFNF